MNFLTTLVVVFCGGTVLVGADFWVEVRAPTPSSSRGRERPTMANYLYKCEGTPVGASAYTAAEIRCTLVTSRDERVNIYLICNFYSVFRPRLQGQRINFSGHHGVMSEVEWHVGYKNTAIDHPNFAHPQSEDVATFRDIVEQMRFVVPQHLMSTLAQYLALMNVIVCSGTPGFINVHFQALTATLHGITNSYGNIDQNAGNATQLKEKHGAAMKVLLEKLIDPCTVLQGNFRAAADAYCKTYCDFLTVVARHFGATSARCTSFEGGRCLSMVCTCFQKLNNHFAGCQSTSSPMQLCTNDMRAKLNMFQT